MLTFQWPDALVDFSKHIGGWIQYNVPSEDIGLLTDNAEVRFIQRSRPISGR